MLQPLICAVTRAIVGETSQERMANEAVRVDGYLSSMRCLVREMALARIPEPEHSTWRRRWRMWLMSLLEGSAHSGSSQMLPHLRRVVCFRESK